MQLVESCSVFFLCAMARPERSLLTVVCAVSVNKTYLKILSDFFLILETETLLKRWKIQTKRAQKAYSFSKWAILHRRMARFDEQNDSFWRAKWAVFECKMSHFERLKNVRKTEDVSFQRFRTCSYFACTRPLGFYFQTMALSEGFFGFFVVIFQRIRNVTFRPVSTCRKNVDCRCSDYDTCLSAVVKCSRSWHPKASQKHEMQTCVSR